MAVLEQTRQLHIPLWNALLFPHLKSYIYVRPQSADEKSFFLG